MHIAVFIHYSSQNVIIVGPIRIYRSFHLKWIKNANGNNNDHFTNEDKGERKDLYQIDQSKKNWEQLFKGIVIFFKCKNKMLKWVVSF